MTDHTLCPNCGVTLRLPPGSLGKRVACGGCKQVFINSGAGLWSNGAARVIQCPFCSVRLRLDAQSQGKKVRCWSCRRPFQSSPAMALSSNARAPSSRQARPPEPDRVVECPFCGVRLRLGPQSEGKRVRCSACHLPFHTNAVMRAAPQPHGKRARQDQSPESGGQANGRPASGNHVRASCPGCRTQVKLQKAHAGRNVRCPYCNHVFRAPRLESGASLRARLLAEVRKMRSRDQAPAAGVRPPPARANAPAPEVPALPSRDLLPDAAAEASGYKVVPQDTPTRNVDAAPPQPGGKPATPKAPLPTEEDDYQILPEELELARNGPMRRRSTKTGRGDYPRIQVGLTLNLVAAALLLGTFIIALVAILCSAKTLYIITDPTYQAGPPEEPSSRVPIGVICLAVLAAISEGIHLVGTGYCLGAPQKDAARTFAMVALLVASAGLSLLCTAGALGLAARFGTGGLVLLIVGLLVTLTAKGIYLLFVRALGLAMEKVWLGRQVYGTILLIAAAVFFHLLVLIGAGFSLTGDVAGVVTGLGNGAGLRDLTFSPLLFWFGSLLILLYALIRCVVTINDARNEVIYHLVRRE